MTRFTPFFREPLVHFFILGAGIFLLSALIGESDDPLDEIVVSAGQVDRLVETWQRTWQTAMAYGIGAVAAFWTLERVVGL